MAKISRGESQRPSRDFRIYNKLEDETLMIPKIFVEFPKTNSSRMSIKNDMKTANMERKCLLVLTCALSWIFYGENIYPISLYILYIWWYIYIFFSTYGYFKKHQKINSKRIFTIYSVPDNFLWSRTKGVTKKENLYLYRTYLLVT